MNLRSAQCVVFPIVAVLCLSTVLFIVNRRAFRQTRKEVVIREPGKRLLGTPQPVAAEARKDLEFAWLSQAAYEKSRPNNETPHSGDCPDPRTALGTAGWLLWPDFPDAGLQQEIARSHLRVEVWVNPSRAAIAVAFGGTVATSGKDWKSNLRWFIPIHDDEYTKIVKKVCPQFVQEFLRRRQEPDWAFLDHATIYATGHSLGGGLAQEFAYALPMDATVPRVTQVFAFDPSPVTGFTSVDAATRDNNKKYLKIDRIYERGEILAILRSFTNFIHQPSEAQPVIRQVRYNLFSRINPITGHSISELACKLNEASHD